MDYPHTFNIFVQVFVDPPGAVIGQEYNGDLGGFRITVPDRTVVVIRTVAVMGQIVVVNRQQSYRLNSVRWIHRLTVEEPSRGNA